MALHRATVTLNVNADRAPNSEIFSLFLLPITTSLSYLESGGVLAYKENLKSFTCKGCEKSTSVGVLETVLIFVSLI